MITHSDVTFIKYLELPGDISCEFSELLPEKKPFEEWLEQDPIEQSQKYLKENDPPIHTIPTTFEDWTQQKEMVADDQLYSPDRDVLSTPEQIPDAVPAPKGTYMEISSPPEISRKIVQEKEGTQTSVQESEQTCEDGSTVRHKVITTRKTKTITEVVSSPTEKRTEVNEKPNGTLIEEEIWKIAAGLTEPYEENSECITTINESSEEELDGTTTVRHITTHVLSPIDREIHIEHMDTAKPEHVATDNQESAQKDVQESEEVCPDGTIVRRKIITTKTTRRVIVSSTIPGIDNQERRDKPIDTLIDEEITRISPEVKNLTPSEVDCDTTTDETVNKLPDNTILTHRITTNIIKPMKQATPPSVDSVLVEGSTDAIIDDTSPTSVPVAQAQILFEPSRVFIGEKESTQISVQESEESREDGSIVKRKVTTNKIVKMITELVTTDGVQSHEIKEKAGNIFLEEEITELPAGVTDQYADNTDCTTTVNETEENMPDGTTVTHRLTRHIVRLLKDTTPPTQQELVTDIPGAILSEEPFTETLTLDKPVDIQVTPQAVRREEKGQTHTSVQESDEMLEDGTTVHKKITTSKKVKTITDVMIIAGLEERQTRDEPGGTNIVEEITTLPPGVEHTCTTSSDLEFVTSVDEKKESQPDGTMLTHRTTTHIGKLIGEQALVPEEQELTLESMPVVQDEFVTESASSEKELEQSAPPSRVVIGEKEGTQTSVQESEETKEDGTTVKRRVATTKSSKMITELVTDDGIEDTREREEPGNVFIDEEITELPAGVTDISADNVDCQTTTDETEETQPDGTKVTHRIIHHIVKSLKDTAPPSQQEILTDIPVEIFTESVPESSPLKKSSDKEIQPQHIGREEKERTQTSVQESEEMLEDGTIVQKKITTTKKVKTITDITSVAGEEERETREEPGDTDVEEEITILPAGVKDSTRSDLEFVTYVDEREESQPDGTILTNRKTTHVGKLVGEQALVPEEQELTQESMPVVQDEFVTDSAPAEKKLEQFAPPSRVLISEKEGTQTSVQESEETKEDGTTVKRRVATTKSIKMITELVTHDGIEDTQEREEPGNVFIDEEITELSAGVTDISAENVDCQTTTDETEETQPDGTKVTHRLTNHIAKSLKDTAPPSQQEIVTDIPGQIFTESVPEISPLEKIFDKDVQSKHIGREEKERTQTSVQESEEMLEDGTMVQKKITTTKKVKTITDIISVAGEEERETREEPGDTNVEEEITILPPGVKDNTRSDVEFVTSVDEKEESQPDGTMLTHRTTTHVGRLVVEEALVPEEQELTQEAIPVVQGEFLSESAPSEKEPEQSAPPSRVVIGEKEGTQTSVQESEETKEDGTTVKRRVATTKSIKMITELVTDDGIEDTQEREEPGNVFIDEEITELPAGVTDISADNVACQTTTDETEETQPDGTKVTHRLTHHIVKPLKDTAPPSQQEIVTDIPGEIFTESVPESSPLEKSFDKEVQPEHIGREEKERAQTSVQESEEMLEDGTIVQKKITTTKKTKTITNITSVACEEERETREEPGDTNVEEEITILPPGVKDSTRSDVEFVSSVDEKEESQPDGTMLTHRTTTHVGKLGVEEALVPEEQELVQKSMPIVQDEFVTESAPLEKELEQSAPPSRVVIGEKEGTQTSVQESEETKEDGTTVKRRVATTKSIKMITELVTDDGIEDTHEREEPGNVFIDEEITELPAGVTDISADNVDCQTTTDETEETQPDGTKVTHRLTHHIVKSLKDTAPPSQQEIVTDIPGEIFTESVPESSPLEKSFDKEVQPKHIGREEKERAQTSVQESEEMLEDGTIVQKKITTTKKTKTITDITSVAGEEEREIREEPGDTNVEEEIIILPPGVKDSTRSDLEFVTSVDEKEEPQPDGTMLTHRTTTHVGKPGVEEALVPEEQELVQKSMPVVQDEFVTESAPPEKELEQSAPPSRVVIGEKEGTQTSVQESEETKEDGTTVKRRVATTKSIKMITELVTDDGIEDTHEREEPGNVFIDEEITELPAGVTDISADNVDCQTTTDETEETQPDGTKVTHRLTHHIVKSLKDTAPPSQQEIVTDIPGEIFTESVPESSPLEKSFDKEVQPKHIGREEKERAQTSVQESEEMLEDGTIVQKKITTTKKTKTITDITSVAGEEEREIREEPGDTNVEEEIIILPPGVKDSTRSDLEFVTSVDEKEEPQPDGTMLTHRTTTHVGKPGVEEALVPEEQELVQKSMPVVQDEFVTESAPPEKELEQSALPSRVVIGEKEGTQTSVQESEETKEDGTTVKRKVATTKYIKMITELVTDDGIEDTQEREESGNVFIDDEITELPAGVTDISADNVDCQTTTDETEETQPDGTKVTHRLTHHIVKSLKDTAPPSQQEIVTDIPGEIFTESVPESSSFEKSFDKEVQPKHIGREEKERAQTSVQESEEMLEDGTIVQKKITTTKKTKTITDITSVAGEEERKTREEPGDTNVEEEITILPPGVKDSTRSDLEFVTSVDEKEEPQPDGTMLTHRTTTHVGKIGVEEAPVPEEQELVQKSMPVVQDEFVTESAPPEKELEQSAPPSRVVIGEKEGTQTSVQESEETKEDGTTVKRKVATTKYIKMITELVTDDGIEDTQEREESGNVFIDEEITELLAGVTDISADNVDCQTTTDETEETQPDGTKVTHRLTHHIVNSLKDTAPPSQREIVTDIPGEIFTESVPESSSFEKSFDKEVQPKHIGREEKERAQTSVQESEEMLEDGTIIQKKITTTKKTRTITDITSVAGEEERQTREEPGDTNVEEEITILPPGVKDSTRSDVEFVTSVDEKEESQPDGTMLTHRTTTHVGKLGVEGAPVPEEQELVQKSMPVVQDEFVTESAPPEKELEQSAPPSRVVIGEKEGTQTSVQESEETKEDGTTVKRKVATTKYIKMITELVTDDGIEDTQEKEESGNVFIDEEITELPAGVTDISADNVDCQTTTDETEETQPDGTKVTHRLTHHIVKSLKDTAPPSQQEIVTDIPGEIFTESVPESSPLEKSFDKEVQPKHIGREEKERAQTSVQESEEMLEDGTIVQKKITTTKKTKTITDITSVAGEEERETREEPGDTNIEEEITILPPGVKDSTRSDVEFVTSVYEKEESQPDGTMLTHRTTTHVGKLGVEEALVPEEQELVQKSMPVVQDEFVTESAPPEKKLEQSAPPSRVVIGEKEGTQTSVQESEETKEDGTTVKRRVTTAKSIKIITELVTDDGIEDTQEREEPGNVFIDEEITELPAGVTDISADNVDCQTTTDETEEAQPDGTKVTYRLTHYIVKSLKDTAPTSQQEIVTDIPGEIFKESVAESSPLEKSFDKEVQPKQIGREEKERAQTSVQESEEMLEDGTIVQKKITTTKKTKTITDITSVAGEEERETREEPGDTNVEEEITILPAGVKDSTRSDVEFVTSVDEKEESQPDGTMLTHRTTTHVGKLGVEEALIPEEQELVQKSMPVVQDEFVTESAPPEKELEQSAPPSRVVIGEKEGTQTSVQESEETTEDGTTVKRRVTTTKSIKIITELVTDDGIEDTQEREEPGNVFIDEEITELPAGVTDISADNVDCQTTTDETEETQPDGTKVTHRLTHHIVKSLKDTAPTSQQEIVTDIRGEIFKESVPESSPLEKSFAEEVQPKHIGREEKERTQTSVQESEEMLEDGTIVHKKITTTKKTKTITDITSVAGEEERETREEPGDTNVEEEITILPPGVKDNTRSDVEFVTSVDEKEESQPDGTMLTHRTTTHVGKLGVEEALVPEEQELVQKSMPVVQDEFVPESAPPEKELEQSAPPSRVVIGEKEGTQTSVQESEETKEDGTTVKRRVTTAKSIKIITELVTDDGIEDTQEREEPGNVFIDEEITELPAGVTDISADNVDCQTMTDETEETQPDGTKVTHRLAHYIVKSLKDTAPTSQQEIVTDIPGEIFKESVAESSPLEKSFDKEVQPKQIGREEKERAQTSVQESEEMLEDGTIVQKKITTTKKTKTITDITSVAGEEERETREEPGDTNVEEEITILPPGVKDSTRSDVEFITSVDEKEESQPDGTMLTHRTTTHVGKLGVEEALVPEEQELVQKSMPVVQDEFVTESAPPEKELEQSAPPSRVVIGEKEGTQTSVQESEETTEDGTTVKRRVTTTKSIKIITELVTDDGIEDTQEREEPGNVFIDEEITELPAGVTDISADNVDCQTTTDETEETQPDGTKVTHRLTHHIVKSLKDTAPTSQQEIVTDIPGEIFEESVPESSPLEKSFAEEVQPKHIGREEKERTQTSVQESEEMLEDGTIVHKKITTTKKTKTITDITSVAGEEERETREEPGDTNVEEEITILPPGVKDNTRSDVEFVTSVDEKEESQPDGTMLTHRTTTHVGKLGVEEALVPEEQELVQKSMPIVLDEFVPESASPEKELEQSAPPSRVVIGEKEGTQTSVQESEETKEDGSTVKRRVTTTKSIKMITELVTDDGIEDTQEREEPGNVFIDEEITELPAGVTDISADNVDCQTTTDETEETQSDGTKVTHRLTNHIAKSLKDTAPTFQQEIVTDIPGEIFTESVPGSSPLEKSFDEEMQPKHTGREEKERIQTSVQESEEMLEDGTIVQKKITTTKKVKTITDITSVAGEEERETREEPGDTNVEEEITILPPGVKDSTRSDVEFITSVDEKEESQPDGTMLTHRTTTHVGKLGVEEALVPEEQKLVQKSMPVVQDEFVTESAPPEKELEQSAPPSRVVIGEKEGTQTSVQESEETKEDGTTVKRRVTTTKSIKIITELVTDDGIEDTQEREEPGNVFIDEEITELPTGVTDIFADDVDCQTTTDETEETQPDGTKVTHRLTHHIVKSLKDTAPTSQQEIVTDIPGEIFKESVPESSPLEKSFDKEVQPKHIGREEKERTQTSVQESEEMLEDGTIVQKKITTTKKTKTITDITSVAGEEERETREEPGDTNIKEEITILPPGVKDSTRSDVEFITSVDEKEESQPDGTMLTHRTTTHVGKLGVEEALVPEEQELVQKSMPVVQDEFVTESAPPEKELEQSAPPSRVVIGEKEGTQTSVQESEETTEDGTTVKRRVTTTKSIKIITELVTDDGIEDTQEREEPGNVFIDEEITELPAGVTDISADNVDCQTTTDETEETQPDGTKVTHRLTHHIVKSLKDTAPTSQQEIVTDIPGEIFKESVPESSPLDFAEEVQPKHIGREEKERTQTSVQESEEMLEDGTIVHKKITTTKKTKTITDITSVAGEEERETREEPGDTNVEEEITILPPGVKDNTRSDVEFVTSVDEKEESQPDGTMLTHRTTTHVGKLGVEEALVPEEQELVQKSMPVVQDEFVPESAPPEKELEQSAPPSRVVIGEKEGTQTSVQESEETKEDGTTVKRRVTTTKSIKMITELVTDDGIEDTQEREEPGNVFIDEEITELPAGVTDISADNVDCQTTTDETEETQPDGTKVTHRLTNHIAKSLKDTAPTFQQEIVTDIPGEIFTESVPGSSPNEKSFDEEMQLKHTGREEKERIQTNVQESEEMLEDGTIVQKKITTTKKVKTITDITSVAGEEERETREEPGDTNVEEEITILPPGVKDSTRSDVEFITSVDEKEESQPDGTMLTHRTTTHVGKLGVEEALVPEEQELVQKSMPVVQDEFVTESAPPEKELEQSAPPSRVVIGEKEGTQTSVQESEETKEDGTTLKRRVTTTKSIKMITELVTDDGIEDTQEREEPGNVFIDEEITDLPAGVTDISADNVDCQTTTDETEETQPDGTKVTHRLTHHIAKSLKDTAPTFQQDIVTDIPGEIFTESVSESSPIEQSFDKEVQPKHIGREEKERTQTSVQESEEMLEDGTMVQKKITTTKKVKTITDITSVAGEEERETREEPGDTNVEEEIIILPPGVEDSTRSDVEFVTSVDEKEESQPDGTMLTRRTTTHVGKLGVEEALVPEKQELVQKSMPVVQDEFVTESAPTEKELEQSAPPSRVVIGEKEGTHTSVQESEETKEDGTNVKRKVATTKSVKMIIELVTIDGVEDTQEREEPGNVFIVEEITELPAGVTDISADNVDCQTTIDETEETQPDGTKVTHRLTHHIVKSLKDIAPHSQQEIVTDIPGEIFTESVPESSHLETSFDKEVQPKHIGREEKERTQTSVQESEEMLEDGTIIQKKITTTKMVKTITDITSVAGEEERETREEPGDTNVEEEITILPPGGKDSTPSDVEFVTSVDEKEQSQPDGTMLIHRTTTHIGKLGVEEALVPEEQELVQKSMPVVQDEFITESTPSEKEFEQPAPPSRVVIGEKEGTQTSVQESEETKEDGTTVKRRVATTKSVKMITELVTEDGIENIQEREEPGNVFIDEEITELPAGVTDVSAENVDCQTTTDETEETQPDGTKVTHRLTHHIVKSLKDIAPPSQQEILTDIPGEIFTESVPESSPLETSFDKEVQPKHIGREEKERTQTSVQESEEMLEDGTMVQKKITTTKKVKTITDITSVAGEEERETREEPGDTNVEEEITILPPGVKDSTRSDVEFVTSVDEKEESQLDGTMLTHRTTTHVGKLDVEQALVSEEQDRTQQRIQTDSVLIDREHKLSTLPARSVIGQKETSQTSVQESEATREDGSVVKRKVTTTKTIKTITELVAVDGVEVTQERQQPGNIFVEEEITELPPGVTDISSHNVESQTSADETEEAQPDGTKITHRIIHHIVTLLEGSTTHTQQGIIQKFPEEIFPEHEAMPTDEKGLSTGFGLGKKDVLPGFASRCVIGEKESTQTSVQESEETADDGTTVKRKVVTTRMAKVITELVTIDGVEDTQEREEPGNVFVEEVITELPPGVTDVSAYNVDCQTLSDETEETQPDGTLITHRLTHHIVKPLKEAISSTQKEIARDIPDEILTEDICEDFTVDQKEIEQKPVAVFEEDILEDYVQTAQKAPRFTDNTRNIFEELKTFPEEDRVSHRQPFPLCAEEPQIMPEEHSSVHRRPHFDDDLPKTDEDYEEIEETLPDGTLVTRRIMKTRVRKIITRKVRKVGPDGEIVEDIITEEIPESEMFSETSSLSDARELTSPVPSLSPMEVGSPVESDMDRGGVRIYTDTVEGEPEVETDVQEFEETLPDGTVIKRKVIKTKQKQTIVKRVVMEGPEEDLPHSEEQAQAILAEADVYEPGLTKYTDTLEDEPEATTDVQEYEETLADGTVVKRRVVTTTEQQMTTERTMMEGDTPDFVGESDPIDYSTEDDHHAVDEVIIEPELHDRPVHSSPGDVPDEDDDVVQSEIAYDEPVSSRDEATEDDIIPGTY